MNALVMFLPQEMLVLLIAAGGIALIVGAQKLGTGLLVTALAMAVLPAFLAPLFANAPGSLLTIVLVGMLIAMLLSGLRWLSNGLIGKRATDSMVGNLASDVVKAVVVGSFRLMGKGFVLLGRLMAALWRA
jgi:hypothetical protein